MQALKPKTAAVVDAQWKATMDALPNPNRLAELEASVRNADREAREAANKKNESKAGEAKPNDTKSEESKPGDGKTAANNENKPNQNQNVRYLFCW